VEVEIVEAFFILGEGITLLSVGREVEQVILRRDLIVLEEMIEEARKKPRGG
jgi:hypothetical protein